MRKHGMALLILVAVAALMLIAACSDGGQEEIATGTPAIEEASPTPLPPDPVAADQLLEDFVSAVARGDAEQAWSLYAASVPGTTEEHHSDLGCDFSAFSFELPRMAHFFAREAPFEVLEHLRNILGSTVLELRLRGKAGLEYLATVSRVDPAGPYRLVTLNSGRVTTVAGAPDPAPSPEDPAGFCGIWTGAR